jgi:hypothetical protein
MMRSIKYQARSFGQYTGITLGGMVMAAVYTLIIGAPETRIIIFNSTSIMMLAMFIFLFSQIYYSTTTNLALSFGETRRNWFSAAVMCRALFGAVCVLLFFCIIQPVVLMVYGQPLTLQWAFLPLAVCAGVFLACLGDTLGFLTLRFCAKWMVITMIGIFLIIIAIALALIIASLYDLGTDLWTTLYNAMVSWWLPLIILAACVPLELASWALLRHIPVKG